eukprot:56980-Rhodomonas_salina.2
MQERAVPVQTIRGTRGCTWLRAVRVVPGCARATEAVVLAEAALVLRARMVLPGVAEQTAYDWESDRYAPTLCSYTFPTTFRCSYSCPICSYAPTHFLRRIHDMQLCVFLVLTRVAPVHQERRPAVWGRIGRVEQLFHRICPAHRYPGLVSPDGCYLVVLEHGLVFVWWDQVPVRRTETVVSSPQY